MISRVQSIGLGTPVLQNNGEYHLHRNNNEDPLVFEHKNGIITASHLSAPFKGEDTIIQELFPFAGKLCAKRKMKLHPTLVGTGTRIARDVTNENIYKIS